ncbi:L,D-transpeptidase family protein [Sphingomonas cannabina]|uniref:L,D-transpeptidase family protein n=1 Tax=Sphingomonas cannabina TaxID=2899123 RepID=UPI001EFFD6CC|nr:L,D-transpeptidase family protein [Sphingomonas cannabina]UIJ46334.1 L,D-transpeptidase family protein [Sphingomonas cannabina]
MRPGRLGRLLLALACAAPAVAQQVVVPVAPGSIIETAQRLKPGEFLWTPQVAPQGPVVLIVSIAGQRAVLYRNGVPIAVTTVSTGRPGYETPTGVFTVLQKEVEHYSSLYDDAPMPYMQRLTWGGVALHAGSLPGYPASHGCIRLPPAFAKLLYGVTRLGMTVVVTDARDLPRLAPAGDPLRGKAGAAPPGESWWHPELAPDGPVSIVISAADRRVVVLRNGREIGHAAVTIAGRVEATTAYVLADGDGAKRQWFSVALRPDAKADPVPPRFWDGFGVDPAFRRVVAAIVTSGTTVVLTGESLVAGSPPFTVLEEN